MRALVVISALFICTVGFSDDGHESDRSAEPVNLSNSYLVSLTPSVSGPVIHGDKPTRVTVNVQTSRPEPLVIKVGVMNRGLKSEACSLKTLGPVTNTQNLVCDMTFSTPGRKTLYVDVDDPRWVEAERRFDAEPVFRPMFSCNSSLVDGCVGTYTVFVE